VVEAVIALASGAAADSIALIGLGLDSGIEVAAASVLLWPPTTRRQDHSKARPPGGHPSAPRSE